LKVDEHNTLIMEHGTWPGNIGDSSADTGRGERLWFRRFAERRFNLEAFITPMGYVRHPTAPAVDLVGDTWREPDFSGDQAMGLYWGFTPEQRKEMRERIAKNWWRTGNNNLIHPGFFFFLYNWRFMISVSVFIQGWLFKLPFRWGDGQNKFESMSESSADYLNYALARDCAAPWARNVVTPEKLKAKIREYFSNSNEPNAEWVCELFEWLIDNPLGKWDENV
jgi:hypothetical protein